MKERVTPETHRDIAVPARDFFVKCMDGTHDMSGPAAGMITNALSVSSALGLAIEMVEAEDTVYSESFATMHGAATLQPVVSLNIGSRSYKHAIIHELGHIAYGHFLLIAVLREAGATDAGIEFVNYLADVSVNDELIDAVCNGESSLDIPSSVISTDNVPQGVPPRMWGTIAAFAIDAMRGSTIRENDVMLMIAASRRHNVTEAASTLYGALRHRQQ